MIGSFRRESIVNFTLDENKARWEEALTLLRDEQGAERPLFLAGENITLSQKLEVRNPAQHSEILAILQKAEQEHLRAACRSAAVSQGKWAELPPAERARILLLFKEKLRKARFDIAALLILEIGLSWRDAALDLARALDALEVQARQEIKLATSSPQQRDTDSNTHLTLFSRGIGALIPSLQSPLTTMLTLTSLSLAAGNGAILLPLAEASLLTSFIVSLWTADQPHYAHLLQVLPGLADRSDLAEILDSAPLDFAAVAGDQVLLARCREARELTNNERNRLFTLQPTERCVFASDELPLDSLKTLLETGMLRFNGMAFERPCHLYLEGDHFDDLLDWWELRSRELLSGNPEDPTTTIGPLTRKSWHDNYSAFAKQWQRMEMRNEGYFAPPMLIPGRGAAQNYPIGPVVCAYKVNSTRELCELANEELSRSQIVALIGAQDKLDYLAKNLAVEHLTLHTVRREPVFEDLLFPGLGFSSRSGNLSGSDTDRLLAFHRARLTIRPAAW